MKKIKFLWTLMALPLLAACSHDDLVNTGSGNGHIPEGEGVYITVNFAPFNKGTRSYTDGNNSSSGGTEVGSSSEDGTINENKITSVLLVLATTSNTYIGSSLVDNTDQTGNTALTANSETLYQAKAVFQKAKIQQFYNLTEVKNYIENAIATSSDPNPPVNIFLYCNPTQTVIDYFTRLTDNPTDWVNNTFTLIDTYDENGKAVQDNSLWTQGKFLMTNESLSTRYFPYDPNTWNQFNTANNAFDLSGMNNRGQSNEVNNYKDGGSINVQRVAARFDFRDGSQIEGPNNNGMIGTPYTYKIIVDADQEPLVLAEIINMSLVNMLKEGYYLGRVATGTDPEQWNTPWATAATETGNNGGYQLLGLEKQWFASTSPNFSTPTGGNYVVTPNPAGRLGTALNANKNFATYYKYPFFSPEGVVATRGFGWYTTPMSAFKDENTYPKDNLVGNYQRWRYVTENTMAGGADDQINGASTGIVFKTKLKSGSALAVNSEEGSPSYNYWDAQLKTALDANSNGPIIFAFSNNLYVSWHHVQYAALRSAGYVVGATTQNLDRTGTFYKAVFGNGGVGTINTTSDKGQTIEYTDNLAEDQTSANYLHSQFAHDSDNPDTSTGNNAWVAFRNKAVANSFTIYEKFGEDTTGDNNKDTWGYYCYYYYWNRHNDNGINGDMAPMEFAVVRNNVYKLAVTSLKKLGHPRIPENDPDDPKPDTPDEKADVYMTVSVNVLPWVVRVNNIEF